MNGEVLVAACDPEILGKIFADGELEITPESMFYGDERVGRNGLLEKIKSSTMVNLLGDNVVDAMIEEGVVDEREVVTVCGIKHAQIITILE
jgi:hypothetical protein